MANPIGSKTKYADSPGPGRHDPRVGRNEAGGDACPREMIVPENAVEQSIVFREQNSAYKLSRQKIGGDPLSGRRRIAFMHRDVRAVINAAARRGCDSTRGPEFKKRRALSTKF